MATGLVGADVFGRRGWLRAGDGVVGAFVGRLGGVGAAGVFVVDVDGELVRAGPVFDGRSLWSEGRCEREAVRWSLQRGLRVFPSLGDLVSGLLAGTVQLVSARGVARVVRERERAQGVYEECGV